MNNYQSGTSKHIHELAAGNCAIVAALVIALHENGILPQEKYRNVLQRLWVMMPEQEAVGEAGVVIEQLFDLLDTGTCTTPTSDKAGQNQETASAAGRSIMDDVIARRHEGFAAAAQIIAGVRTTG